jgi:MoaA/NifB/PqqE/SkfB family radical SAM enzyme
MTHPAYSDLKAAYHLDKLKEMRDGQQIVPCQMQLIISDLCNQDCHFCHHRMSGGLATEQFADGGNKNPNRKIPTKKALEIISDAAKIGIKAIQFTGGGEPTVHPDHMEIFEHALNTGLGCSLVTNLTKLGKSWEEVLPEFNWIRVSLDAGFSDDYAAIRASRPEVFDKVLGNLQRLAEAVPDSCLLGVGFVVTRQNWRGIVKAAEIARAAGAKYIRYSAMFGEKGAAYYDELKEEVADLIKLARKRQERPGFELIDLFGSFLADLDQGRPDYDFCGYQQFNLYVGGNLKVYRCCTTSYTSHGEIGDLTEQTLKEWFRSPEKKINYKCFSARSCDVCHFNSKNRAIEYLTQGEPLHVDYV